MRSKFKSTQKAYIVNAYYHVDVIRKEQQRWTRKEMCVGCRNATKFFIWVKIHLNGDRGNRFMWCCGPDCLKKELEILNLEVIEKITGV